MMNRREFLAASAAMLALGADAPEITFGFTLYGMKSLPLDDALKTCASIGYQSVELALMPGYHNDFDRAKLRDRLRELKLTLPALMENLPLDVDEAKLPAQHARLKAACEIGRALSPEAPPVIETILGGKPGQWEMLKEAFVKRLADWAKIAAEGKTVIAIKPHRMQAVNLPEHALWLLEKVGSPWIRHAFDWSHYEGRDLSMADVVKLLAPATRFVHVKDTVFDKDKATFVLPGEGTTDYRKLVGLLKEAGYRGCVCVEVSGMVSGKKDYDPVAAARKCYTSLAPAFH